MTAVYSAYSSAFNSAFYNTSPEFALRCGHWACGCMDGNCGFTSCAETIKYYQDCKIVEQERKERERLREEAWQRELLERPPAIVVPVSLPVVQSITVSLSTIQEKPRHQHRRPAQTANGPCTCANLTCTKQHKVFVEHKGSDVVEHKCCSWVENIKTHSCNSTKTREVVIDGVTCISCEVGLHRPGLNTWKP